jgi:isoleucyl-tRNA synthetase
MGVHHAWGRSYKDLWQRYKAMHGMNERWQNGFDCQGLWVEVEVEKSLNLKTKRDIEAMGIDQFVRLCKARVLRAAAQQTEQTIRLGNWMDWNNPDELRMLADKLSQDPMQHITLERDGKQVHGTVEQLVGALGMPPLMGSYFTFSNENNYQIWTFLKKCYEHGWVYRGADVIPWCPRCATGISQHEMETDGYKDREDPAFTVRMKLLTMSDLNGQLSLVNWSSDSARDKFTQTQNKYILAWTTTPWTLASNTMCAVGPKLKYSIVYQKHKDGEEAIYLLGTQTHKLLRGEYEVLGEILGEHMAGWTYAGLFDDLPAWIDAEKKWQDKHGFEDDRRFAHPIILWDGVGEVEGTGIVHNAPGCGPDDYKLGVAHSTPMVEVLNENGNYIDGFGPLSGKYGHDVPDLVEQLLRAKGNMYRRDKYVHRYAHCWRCKTPLLYRKVDEWYISMDELRHQMMRVSNEMNWIPSFGKEREMDWLKNMHDWMISKKRYWGLALPIWEYPDGTFEVIGSYEELKSRAVEGWDAFDGHTPHRPWIDQVKIKHPQTGLIGTRVPDVGNPWLDAGIVAYSTLRHRTDHAYWEKWFPGDFITESFPGQFRNWFYSLIAMSTVMENQYPAKTVLGFATLLDEKGEQMHKSKGNSIEFNEAADRAGADVMRWLYARQKYEDNLLFGWNSLDHVRRDVFIPLWNVYAFFCNYASLDKWTPEGGQSPAINSLDEWILARKQEVVNTVTAALDAYDARTATLACEKFVDDLSNWYVRRSRRRFWKSESDADKNAAYATLYDVLTTFTKLIAPVVPFLTEAMWQNLRELQPVNEREFSVHHQAYPTARALTEREINLLREVEVARATVTLGHSLRAQSNVKLRQPLAKVVVVADDIARAAIQKQNDVIADELNVKAVEFAPNEAELVTYKLMPDLKKLGKKLGADLPKVREAFATADTAHIVKAVRANQPVTLAGRELAADEIIVRAEPREGLLVEGADGIVVALDTHLDDALVNEGLAREVVRRINDLRKAQGFEIADRIHTTYQASPRLTQAISAFEKYITAETLSLSLKSGMLDNMERAEFDNESLKLKVVKI